MKQTQTITWVLQESEEGEWAVFVVIGGDPMRVSQWYRKRAQAMAALLQPATWGGPAEEPHQ